MNQIEDRTSLSSGWLREAEKRIAASHPLFRFLSAGSQSKQPHRSPMPNSTPSAPTLAIIGGSGLYNMPGLTHIEEHALETPFRKPSDPVVVGRLRSPASEAAGNGRRVAFLARHGKGHRFSPTEVNYRANIFALKMLGVERIVAVSACGSLREDYAPGHIVIPDQLYDHTKSRERTFFGEGLVAHIGTADPFCPTLSQQLWEAVQTTGATAHRGGAFITIEGPRFSTKAESKTFRQWGMDIIGMTAVPEAQLAREAEICYATMAHVTDRSEERRV